MHERVRAPVVRAVLRRWAETAFQVAGRKAEREDGGGRGAGVLGAPPVAVRWRNLRRLRAVGLWACAVLRKGIVGRERWEEVRVGLGTAHKPAHGTQGTWTEGWGHKLALRGAETHGTALSQVHPSQPSPKALSPLAGLVDLTSSFPRPPRSYGLILLLLMFAIIYVTVISKRGKQEAWLVRARCGPCPYRAGYGPSLARTGRLGGEPCPLAGGLGVGLGPCRARAGRGGLGGVQGRRALRERVTRQEKA